MSTGEPNKSHWSGWGGAIKTILNLLDEAIVTLPNIFLVAFVFFFAELLSRHCSVRSLIHILIKKTFV